MSTRTPALEALRKRACLDKDDYATEAEAALGALTLMAGNATKPISAYACTFCSGYHLTSSDQVNERSVAIEKPLAAAPIEQAIHVSIAKRSRVQGQQKHWRRESSRIRDAIRRDEERTARFYEDVSAPRVADSAEIDAFFTAHGTPTGQQIGAA